jgi:hypothetical protein
VESQIDPWHNTDMTDPAPKHPKRPRDPAQLAKLMVDIATGEVEDAQPVRDDGKQQQTRKPHLPK